MKESETQELFSVLLGKLFYVGAQLILPLLSSICLVFAFYKLKSLASAGVHPSLAYISYALLCFALYIIVPILSAPLLIFLGGDAVENYVNIILSSVAFLFVIAGTILLFKAASLI